MNIKRTVGFELFDLTDRIICLDCIRDPDFEDAIRDAQPIRAGGGLSNERCTECGRTLWETAFDCGTDRMEDRVF